MVKAVILAGGKGERFGNISGEIPKVMASLNEKPLLEHTINWLKQNGVNEVVLCTGYKKEFIEDYFGNGEKFNVSIKYSHEDEPKGTGGALKLAEKYLDETFVLINGDCLIDCDLKKAIEKHENEKSIATINLTEAKNPEHQELIKFDDKFNVLEILQRNSEKHKEHMKNSNELYCNSGLFIFEPEVLKELPEEGKYALEPTLFPKLFENNKKVKAFYENGVYIEIGNPELYKKASENINVKKFLEAIGE